MPKKPASTSLENDIYERVARLAKVDRRSIAQILEQCVERGLPDIEADVLRGEIREEPLAYKVVKAPANQPQVKHVPGIKKQKAEKN
jgi:predicted DNA-binding protein